MYFELEEVSKGNLLKVFAVASCQNDPDDCVEINSYIRVLLDTKLLGLCKLHKMLIDNWEKPIKFNLGSDISSNRKELSKCLYEYSHMFDLSSRPDDKV